MKHKTLNRLAFAVALPALFACTGLEPNPDDTSETAGGNDITLTNNGDNTVQVIVNATSESDYIYLDLDSLSQVAADSADWDLSFQRFNVAANSGISGEGHVYVAVLEEQDFATLSEAPSETETTYLQDVEDGDDEDVNPDLVFSNYPEGTINNGWYSYDPTTHLLSAREDVVYVVLSTEHQPFKLQMLDYYSSVGTSGYITFNLSGLFDGWSSDAVTGETDTEVDEEPETVEFTANTDGSFTAQIDASDYANWVFVDLETMTQVEPATPTDSDQWDIAFQRTDIQLNGGLSGTGDLSGTAVVGTSFADLTVAPSFADSTYFIDTDVNQDGELEYGFGTFPAALSPFDSGWYNYNPSTHHITARDVVYVISTLAGDYYKIQLLSYYNDDSVSGHISFDIASVSAPSDEADGCYNGGELYTNVTNLTDSAANAVTVDASDSSEYVYFDLELGSQVYPCNVSNSTIWDIGFSRTNIIINSGVSGSGSVQAGATDTAFDSLAAAGDLALNSDATADTLVFATTPVATASGDAGWYNYNFTTHQITVRDTRYVIQTNEGNFFKLELTGYYSGGTSGFPQFNYAEIDE